MKTFEVRADSSMILNHLEFGELDSIEDSQSVYSRHVGSVEELDGISTTLTSESVTFDRDFDSESLEVNDEGEDGDSSDKVHDVGKSFTVESFLECSRFVVPGEEEVEEGDESTFKFGSSSSVDGSRRECLPHDRLADIGSDEQVDS